MSHDTAPPSGSEPPRLFDRELSWIEFNHRVLSEAMDPSNPLLERVMFTGIVSSNLDEFFQVRVASLVPGSDIEKQVRQQAYRLSRTQAMHFNETLVPELAAAGIRRLTPAQLDDAQREFASRLFDREIFPVLTPIALTGDRAVPALNNLSIYMVFTLIANEGSSEREYAVVEVPPNLSRMITLPSGHGHSFILIGDVIREHAARLFQGYSIESTGLMRLTRGAEMTLDEERDDDFTKVMAEALRERKRGAVMRLEIDAPPSVTAFVRTRLSIPEDRVFETTAWFDLKGISSIAFLPGYDALRREPWRPVAHPAFEEDDEDIWQTIREGDVLLHLPYESFDPVLRLVSQAADDPEVLAIKQTLYRTAPESRLVRSLERAAENGKRVTVLVELKARFDEAENIQWANRLERAGASVIYGVAKLKTHAKACLIVRRESDGIRRYAHLATGNYNESTAKIYSDLGIFTCNERLTSDVASLFNMITGFSKPTELALLTIAPLTMRKTLLRLVQRETLLAEEGRGAAITLKMNSLVDEELIEALYTAAQAGVKIRLNIRGTCCLVPGVPGRSEGIEVCSIIGRFLEHSRIFWFRNGGDDRVYLSSADWMPRNIDRRVETMFPILDAKIRKQVMEIADAYFRDDTKSWTLESDGSYERKPPGENRFHAQEYFCEEAKEADARRRRAVPREFRPRRADPAG